MTADDKFSLRVLDGCAAPAENTKRFKEKLDTTYEDAGYKEDKEKGEMAFVFAYYRSAMIWDELERAGAYRVYQDPADLLRQALATGAPLGWSKVNDLPDYVVFDHRAHRLGRPVFDVGEPKHQVGLCLFDGGHLLGVHRRAFEGHKQACLELSFGALQLRFRRPGIRDLGGGRWQVPAGGLLVGRGLRAPLPRRVRADAGAGGVPGPLGAALPATGSTISAPARLARSMNAPIAEPVLRKASRISDPSSGVFFPRAKRASGVGTGEKVFVSCFIWAITSFTRAPSAQHLATVDDDRLSGDPARQIAREEQDHRQLGHLHAQ